MLNVRALKKKPPTNKQLKRKCFLNIKCKSSLTINKTIYFMEDITTTTKKRFVTSLSIVSNWNPKVERIMKAKIKIKKSVKTNKQSTNQIVKIETKNKANNKKKYFSQIISK